MAKGIMYVDNIRVEFDDEPTIMDVCRKAGVEMPNFCFCLLYTSDAADEL